MKRRAFLQSIASGALAIQTVPVMGQFISEGQDTDIIDLIRNSPTVEATPELKNEFNNLLLWLQENRWTEFFKESFGLNIEPGSLELNSNLSKDLQGFDEIRGFEDFAGCKAIEPGFPSMSLIYHALASARVTPIINGNEFSEEEYPDLQKLDILENYIVSLKDIQIKNDDFKKNYVFALFSYEYRPAFKTPDKCPYAEFVYSRTGISRIGQHKFNYSKKKRGFINEPEKGQDVKEIATTPARYGLFLAKIVDFENVKAISEERSDIHNYLIFKTQRSFLQPIKKIFDGDSFIGGGTIHYMESHKNEKLKRLHDRGDLEISKEIFDVNAAPFVRISSSDELGKVNMSYHNTDLVNLSREGSTVLLSSVPNKIIRVAEQNGKTVCFTVPEFKKSLVESNRRYTTLKLQGNIYKNAYDYAVTEGIAKNYKATRFGAPRNSALFVNIRYKVNKSNFKIDDYYGHDITSHEKIYAGGYLAAMFEDSICDGCVTASVIPKNKIKDLIAIKIENILPAFSIVAAPDFFPLADSYDLMDYDKKGNSSFMEGGYENLSGSRLLANPNIIAPDSGERAFPDGKKTRIMQGPQNPIIKDNSKVTIKFSSREDEIQYDSSDTLLAIISAASKPFNDSYKGKEIYKFPKERDYDATSYLCDTASFIFAPGWDVTYSREEKGRTFLATFGLGSPFPEDMKLCAAANGMWPVASPDAARTFQGGLKPLPYYNTVPPCAIPLMDDEIGYHWSHPEVKSKNISSPYYGWDGEHGPYFEAYNNLFWVNFTDIGSSDYIENLRDEKVGFNMEKLRKLNSRELINRIECLRLCKLKVEGTKKEFSTLWLVSAEKVNWNQEVKGYGVPSNLVGKDKIWALNPQKGIEGEGYLYVFADPVYDEYNDKTERYLWAGDRKDKRRRIKSRKIVLCQVTRNKIAWCEIAAEGYASESLIEWSDGEPS